MYWILLSFSARQKLKKDVVKTIPSRVLNHSFIGKKYSNGGGKDNQAQHGLC